jgi:hypothetical protein
VIHEWTFLGGVIRENKGPGRALSMIREWTFLEGVIRENKNIGT